MAEIRATGSEDEVRGLDPYQWDDDDLVEPDDVTHDLYRALVMVRDADDDCRRDHLPTIPAPARARMDAAIARAEEAGIR